MDKRKLVAELPNGMKMIFAHFGQDYLNPDGSPKPLQFKGVPGTYFPVRVNQNHVFFRDGNKVLEEFLAYERVKLEAKQTEPIQVELFPQGG